MNPEKTRYWLKLDKGFLKSPHIKIIKSMPNGKDYVLFYLSLMLESIEFVGHLKFTDLIPYNEEMLSALTDTNIDIVKSAVEIFQNLGLIEILDDGTIFLNQVAQLTGKRTDSAERVAKHRLHKKQECYIVTECNTDVTECNDNKERRKKKEESTEKKKESTKKKCNIELLKQLDTTELSSNLQKILIDWFSYKDERKQFLTERSIKTTINKIKKYSEQYDETKIIDVIEDSIANNWQGIIYEKLEKGGTKNDKNSNVDATKYGINL